MGPGANTAALNYYSSMIPEEFWGNIFMANWGSHGANPTNRTIKQFLRPKAAGKDVKGPEREALQESPDMFLTSTDSMFRPVSLASAHNGALYLADWHRRDDESNKTGRIFEILYTGKKRPAFTNPLSPEEINRMNPVELCRLLDNKNRFIRQQAQRKLVQFGADALEPLGKIVREENAFASANAIWTLTQMNSVEASKTMTLALKHPDPRVRALALSQLRQAAGQPLGGLRYVAIGARDAELNSCRLLNVDELAKLAKPLVNDQDGEVRVEAALALNSTDAITRGLIAALNIETNERLRYQIAFELGRYGDLPTLEKLYRASDPSLKRVAIIAAETAINENTPLATSVRNWDLTVAKENEAEELVAEIQSGKVQAAGAADQLMALEWLEEHPVKPTKPLWEFLSTCLRDHDYLVQAAALRTARHPALHSPEIRSAIIDILSKKGQASSYIQLEALYTLGSLRIASGPEDWLPWLKDTSNNVVIATLRALHKEKHKAEFMSALWPAALAKVHSDPSSAEEV